MTQPTESRVDGLSAYLDSLPAPKAQPSARRVTPGDSLAGYLDHLDSQPAPEKKPQRTTLEAAKDAGLGAAAGVVQGVGMVAGAFGADNAVARGADGLAQDMIDSQSDARKAQRRARAEQIRQAEASGSSWEEIKANVGAFLEAPVETTLNALGTSAPTLLMGFIPGLGQANAARLILQGAMGAAQGAGSVKGSIYEAVERKLVESGHNKDDAAKVAAGAQAYDSQNAGQIALGAILGAAAGSTGIERSLGRVVSREGSEAAARGLAGRTAMGVAKEAPVEGVQGGQERLAANLALQNQGFEQPTWQGVAGQAAGEAVASAVPGGVFGALEPSHPAVRKAAEPNSPLSRAVAAVQPQGPEAAAPQQNLNPISLRAAEIAARVRSEGLLDRLREIGQPGRTVTEFLDAMTVAQNGQADPELRAQALESLEMALGWIDEGRMPSDPATGNPFSTELTVPGESGGELTAPGQPGFFDPNTVDVDAVRVDNMLPGPRALPGPAATEETADHVPESAQAGEEAGAPQGPQAAPTGQPAATEPAAQPVARRQVQPPKVAPPAGDGSAQRRQRKAQLAAMAADGFETVERRNDGFWLVNSKRREEMRLEGAGDAQMARKAIADQVNSAAHQAAASPQNDLAPPSEAQIEAENYKKGHMTLNGLDISIENPRGSTRSGTGPDGKKWESTMAHHYGYFKRTEGADGDALDVFVGPRPDSDRVFVIDQLDRDGRFDEHKVMMGFPDEASARAGYLANYEPGWTGLGAITPMSAAEFKAWARSDAALRPASPTIAPKPVFDESRVQAAQQRTAQDRAAVAALSQDDNDPSLRLADADPDGNALRALLAAAEKVFGVRGIAVASEANRWDGAEHGGQIFVNVRDPRMHVAQTIGHELAHTQEGVFPALRERLWAMVSEEGKRAYFEGYLYRERKDAQGRVTRPRGVYARATPEQLAHLKSEMLADFFGNRFNDRAWLRQLGQQKPALFGAFVRDWLAMLDSLVAALKGMARAMNPRSAKNVDAYLGELEQAKAIAIEVVAEWATRHQKLARQAGVAEAVQHSAREVGDINDLGAFNLDAGLEIDEDLDLDEFLQAELQAELEAQRVEPAKASKPAGRPQLEVSDAEIEAQGLMAEAAYPPLAWEDPEGDGYQLVAHVPDLYQPGKVARITMDQERNNLWRMDMRGTWVGPAEAEAGAFATEAATKAFASRQVAAKDLRERGFDLAETLAPAQRRTLAQAWQALSEVPAEAGRPGVRRYARPDRRSQSLKDIAREMGITDQHELEIFQEPTGPGSSIVMIEFLNKETGDARSATLDIVRVDGRRHITAHTGSLGKTGLGAAFYQMVAEYAARSNAVITPDHALSGVNTYRRTEQQLSAALRTGKSNVMVPHPVQRVYGFDDKAQGQEAHEANIARLALAGLRNAREIAPEIDSLVYDPETGKFADRAGDDAEPMVTALLADVDARAFGLGRATVARAALTRMVLDGELQADKVRRFAEPVLYSERGQADLFPEDFADKAAQVDTDIVISSKGATLKGGNVDSADQQITSSRQGLESFWRWFGPSVAVDDENRPLRLHHSTNGDFSVFEPGRKTTNNYGLLGDVEVTRSGIFLTPDLAFSQEYLREGSGQNVMPVYLALRNPFDMRRGLSEEQEAELIEAGVNGGWLRSSIADWERFDSDEDGGNFFTEALRRLGYDGAIIVEQDRQGEPHDTYVAFDSSQIKSAIGNRGTFSPVDPDIRYSARNDAAIGDKTDVSKLPDGKAVPDAVGVGSLEASLAVARAGSYRIGRELKLDLQQRVREAAKAAGVDLTARTKANHRFLAGMVQRDARYALQSNENAVGWYDSKVSRALGALATLHPEIATDPESRLAFLWALAATSNGLKVDKNFELAERAYQGWKAHGAMPSNIGIGTAAGQINDGLALFNELGAKLGAERLAKFMSTEFTAGDIERMLGIKAGGEWTGTPVRGAAVLGPKIGNGFFSNLNGYFGALTMDRWLMRSWGRMTGTLIDIDAQKVTAARQAFAKTLDALSETERRVLTRLVGAPVRKRMTRAEIDQAATAIDRASEKKDRRELMSSTPAMNRFRLDGRNLARAIDGQKEVPSGPAERNWIRAVFQSALDALRDSGLDMTMSDLQALLWYPERRLYDAAKSDEEVADGYEDDEAPDYANAAMALALQNGVPLDRLMAAMDQAESRGTVQGEQLSDDEKQAMLREFRKPPAQAFQLAFEVAPDPADEAMVAAWEALPVARRTEITSQVKEAVVDDVAKLVGVEIKKTVGSTGGYAGHVNPNLISEYQKTRVSIERARGLAAAIGYVLDQDSVALVDERASEAVGLIRVTFSGKVEKHAQAVFDAIRAAVPAVDAFTARGNNFDVLNFTGMSDAELASEINAALDGAELGLDSVVTFGEVRSELVERDSYGQHLEGVRPGSGPEIRTGVEWLRDRARQIVAEGIRGGDHAGGAGRAGAARLAAGAAPARHSERDGDRAGRDPGRGLAPLPGAPAVVGAAGPDPRLVEVAERYARERGIALRRQAEYVKVDPARAARIAAAYEAMPHAPQDPRVKAAYEDLIRQTMDQYRALERAGYRFYLFDESNDPYAGNPWNAMRDLRANRVMGVFATEAGFGSGASEIDVNDNPLLADTGIRWPYGSPDGEPKRVLANDLFRAVHDAFGHGLEGAGFRADGEENAWQTHVRLFTGAAVGAITSETRGQNSWLNYGPYGERNHSAAVEDTVFADQKTGLMPEWAWTEGRVGDEDISSSPAYGVRYSARAVETRAPDELFYSELARQVQAATMKQAPAGAWKSFIKALTQKGVKADEIEWSGVNDWLDLQVGKVGKDALLGFLAGNGVRVEEVVLGRDGKPNNDEWEPDDGRIGNTRYGNYTLPGGENYREILLTLPSEKPPITASQEEKDAWASRGVYKSSHWSQPNILAHIRVNDRTDADGARVLFVEELQSDWGQEGKKNGFSNHSDFEVTETSPGRFVVVQKSTGTRIEMNDGSVAFATREAAQRAIDDGRAAVGYGVQRGVPLAPFVTKTDGWLNLALKRVIGLAVDGGYDKLAFVTGEQSAERYDLSKQIDQVQWIVPKPKTAPEKGVLYAYRGGTRVMDEKIATEQVEDYVGKEVARRLLESKPAVGAGGSHMRTLSGLELKVGGEGMKAFYDQIVPNAAKSLLKKLGGGSLEQVTIGQPRESRSDYSIKERATGGYVARIGAEAANFASWEDANAWLNERFGTEQPGFAITPALREKVGGGLPLFSLRSDWDAPQASRFDDFVYKAQNKMVDVKRVVESITKAVGQIADDINVYLQEELFHGRAAKRAQDFGRDELQPLLKAMAEQGLAIGDVEEFLHARHAREANALIASREPGLPDGGSGMTNAAADAYFARLDAATRQKLEGAAAQVDAILARTRQLYADYGLESQDTVDGWAQMFQHYVPLQREDKGQGMGIGQGFSVRGKEVKGRTGSTRKVVDILGNIALQRERVIVRGEKNRVAAALVGLASAHPNADFWTVGRPPDERVYDPATNSVIERVDPMFKSRENVVVAKIRDGVGNVDERAVVFNEDDPRALRMAQALKNLDAGNLEGLLGVSAKITRYFAAVNTQYNPVFGVVNLVRDVQGALVNLGSTPLAGQQTRIARDTLSALRGIYGDIRAARRGGQQTSAWAQLWEEFQREGGQTGYRELFRTGADRAQALQDLLAPDAWMDSKLGRIFTAGGMLRKPMSEARKSVGWLFDLLSDYNEAMENGVRLAAYKAAVDQGLSKRQAASVAKNLTVNFNRRGQMGMQAGAVYAFFNAAMQGSARIGQALFEMEGGSPKTLRLSRTGKAVVYGGLVLGSLQALMLAVAGFDDEDPPEFVRERALIIPTGGKTYVSIPMPLGLHVIPGLGRHATEFALSGFAKPAQRFASVFGMFADAFNPIGNAGLSMQTLAPTALDPLVALTENKDWTGKPIARISSNPALPGHQQWKDTATGVSKVIAEAVNALSGGNQYVAGVLSPTPDQIDYLIAQVTGGVGRELSKVEQAGRSLVNGESLPTHKIPLLGRFVGNTASQASEGAAFYANVDRLNELETEIKGLRKDGKAAEVQALLRSRPDAYLMAQANAAERQVQRLKREKRELIESGAPRERVAAKEAQITATMARLNRVAERVRGMSSGA